MIPVFNVPLLDSEHRDLLLFAEEIKNNKNNIHKIILHFLDEIQYHFYHEESFMLENAYPHPKLIKHIKEHSRLRMWFFTQIISLERDIVNKKKTDKQIQSFSDALIEHFQTFDLSLAEWLVEVKK